MRLVPSAGGRKVASPLVVAAVLLLGATGCGGNEDDDQCGPVRREPLDRRSLLHVLPGAPAPDYRTDPPTSGPHQPSPPLSGVREEPVDRPVQVGVLEEGKVLLQHRGLSAPDRRELEDQAGPEVVVAPSRSLPGTNRVVATAWLAKQTCAAVDSAVIERFVSTHLGRGPGGHGG